MVRRFDMAVLRPVSRNRLLQLCSHESTSKPNKFDILLGNMVLSEEYDALETRDLDNAPNEKSKVIG